MDKIKLHRDQLEFILQQIKELENEHPKAHIFYDVEYQGVQVVYPLPRGFKEFQERKEV